MRRIPRISDAEWQVMEVLWVSPGLTADEVIDTLKGKVDWGAPTVRTLINRLLQKKALTFKKEGRKYRYWSTVNQESCIRQERLSFIERIYGGTVTPMLAAFIEDAQLSQEEIEALKRILDQKGAE